MFRNFEEIEAYILSHNLKKRIALANAQDDVALSALIEAKHRGVADAVLIGDEERIRKYLKEAEEKEEDYTIISCETEKPSADLACRLVKEGKADIPMKGLMQTSNFMKAILNKENGFFPAEALLSQATVLQYEEENRFMIISDCAVNIAPGLEEKKKITLNAVKLAHTLGIGKPNIAFLSALEKVNPKIPSTVDAAELARCAKEGLFGEIGFAAGPLALDIAVSEEAAAHKGISSPVCGHADILIVPDLCSGNIFTKGLTFLAHMKSAGTLNGSEVATVMTSRADTPEDKYFSILTAILQSAQ